MKLRVLFFLGLLALISPVLASAGSSCATPTILLADGRVTDFDFVAASSSNFYQFQAVTGRSYSVEARQDYDDVNTDLTVTSGTGCAGGAVSGALATTDTHLTEPVIASNGTRFSFTAAAGGTINLQIANGNVATGRYVSVSVTDTTFYNPQWSTFIGFNTNWQFQNTSTVVVHGVLTATEAGGTVHSEAVTIPAGGVANAFANDAFTTGGAIAANKTGSAVFTNDAPPGAVLAQAFFLTSSASVVVPSKFEQARRGSH